MASRPVVIPETFSGEESWYDWLDHFESVAEVNKWDNVAKLPWLRARMTGQAQIAYKQLSEGAQANYAACVKGLRERFELDCKKKLYLAKFETRCKRKTENWAAFAENLKTLINKALSAMLQNNARNCEHNNTLQKLKYNIHTKLPLESYQI